MGTAIAAKVLAHPELLEIGRQNLRRLDSKSLPARALLAEWVELIAAGPVAVAAVLTEDSDRGHDLRQMAPFAGVLTNAERWAVLDEVYGRAAG